VHHRTRGGVLAEGGAHDEVELVEVTEIGEEQRVVHHVGQLRTVGRELAANCLTAQRASLRTSLSFHDHPGTFTSGGRPSALAVHREHRGEQQRAGRDRIGELAGRAAVGAGEVLRQAGGRCRVPRQAGDADRRLGG